MVSHNIYYCLYLSIDEVSHKVVIWKVAMVTVYGLACVAYMRAALMLEDGGGGGGRSVNCLHYNITCHA